MYFDMLALASFVAMVNAFTDAWIFRWNRSYVHPDVFYIVHQGGSNIHYDPVEVSYTLSGADHRIGRVHDCQDSQKMFQLKKARFLSL